MFKTLATIPLAASLVVSSFAAPAVALDAAQWAADHPDVTAQAADELLVIEAPGARLEDFLWLARPVVVFADSPNDPRFIQQMEYLGEDPVALAERDVVVIVDTDPGADSAIREALRPRGFDLVVIGKDGFKYLRKPMPWNLREITRSIDKMPLRLQELREMRGK